MRGRYFLRFPCTKGYKFVTGYDYNLRTIGVLNIIRLFNGHFGSVELPQIHGNIGSPQCAKHFTSALSVIGSIEK